MYCSLVLNTKVVAPKNDGFSPGVNRKVAAPKTDGCLLGLNTEVVAPLKMKVVH